MKIFRTTSLPLVVGALFIFCGAPGARAATDCDWDAALENHRITAANVTDVKSMIAGIPNRGLVFLDLPNAIRFDTGQLRLTAGGTDQVWNLAIIGLSHGMAVAAASLSDDSVSASGISSTTILPRALVASLTADATDLAAPVTPTEVPEASSLLYLGAGVVFCSGFWLRRRRF